MLLVRSYVAKARTCLCSTGLSSGNTPAEHPNVNSKDLTPSPRLSIPRHILMMVSLTRSSSFVDRDFIILRSRLLTEPRILVREYGTIPVDLSDDAGEKGGISGRCEPD